MRPEIRSFLQKIRKPYRLAGGEKGSLVKSWENTQVKVCLAFPDVYDIGMSNLGLAILYDIINAYDDYLAERVFALWPDAEAELRSMDIPLFSLESQHSINEFDIIGISLPYELTYTNVLQILDLGGIPFRSEDRDDRHPLIIGGGPGAFNPEPVADFFDAIVLGDGEEVVIEIANAVADYKNSDQTKAELLDRLSKICGIYIPGSWRGAGDIPNVHGQSQPAAKYVVDNGVRKAIVYDLNDAPFPQRPVSPHAAIQDRVGIEIQRGCVRGCRFCQAGMIYRPLRQRDPAEVSGLVSSQLESSGHTDLSLLSLSVGDYACLEDVLIGIGSRWESTHLNISLPSLRTESLTGEMLKRLGKDRAGSFTLAPEAATERMRGFINKGNTDNDLYESVEKVFQNGWGKIKLYFMVGLPGETEEEIEGIVRMANRCLDIGRKYHRRPDVTVSTSTFVPKPHTPLQWSGQIDIERSLEIQRYLKKRLHRPGIYYRWHNAQMSFMEGVFSRGGRELSTAIEYAYKCGARFDGWDECFSFERWLEAFDKSGIDSESYLKEREKGASFAWDHLFVDLKKDFLWREYEKARHGELTKQCSDGPCQGCGVCDFKDIKNVVYKKERLDISERNSAQPLEKFTCKFRVRFSKRGRAVYLGHLELMDAVRRIVRSAGLPVCYTEGYHPRPKISLGRALPVGIESMCEYGDMSFEGEVTPDQVLEKLNGAAPEGIEFLDVFPISDSYPSIDQSISASRYEVSLPGGRAPDNAIEFFKANENLPFIITRKGKEKEIDIKRCVTKLAVVRDYVVGLTIVHGEPAVKVPEAVTAIFGLSEDELCDLNVRKVDVELRCPMN